MRLWFLSSAALIWSLNCGDPGMTSSTSSGSGGGTSSSSSGEPLRKICDGTSGIRLAYQQLPKGSLGMGQALLFQNGRYLFVDGQCHYWVFGTKDLQPFWQETRSGTLTEAQEEALGAALDYPHWSSATAFQSGCDMPEEWLWGDGVFRVVAGACHSPSMGPYEELLAEAKAARGWIDTLWTSGAPVGGPVRLRVVRQPADVPNNRPKVSWPLQIDIESVAIDLATDINLSLEDPGYLVDADPGISVLRSYREQLLAGSLSEFVGQELIISIEANGAVYNLFFRDTVPYEDDQGLLRSPMPQP